MAKKGETLYDIFGQPIAVGSYVVCPSKTDRLKCAVAQVVSIGTKQVRVRPVGKNHPDVEIRNRFSRGNPNIHNTYLRAGNGVMVLTSELATLYVLKNEG